MRRCLGSMSLSIGNTPLLPLEAYENAMGCCGHIYAKVESFNPGGSAKDRVALSMIEKAEEEGRLTPVSVIIEPTSGNTGIGLALVGKEKGYRVILTMPDTMSVERRTLLASYGAEVVLTEGSKGMNGAIAKAEELARSIPHSFIPNQFKNMANPHAHFTTTAPEIWEQSRGQIDIFVAGVGTGGTITGVGRFLKEKNPNISVVAVEPADSPVLSGGKSGPHKLQGMGAGFVPKVLDTTVYDRITTVTTEDAYETARLLYSTQNLLCGISSGAALWAATKLAQEPENEGKTIVVLLPDTGERYLSVPGFLN